MSEDDWVAQNPVPALEFVLAGSLSERQALAHCLYESYYGDITAWRSGMGALGPLDPADLDRLAGGPFPTVVKRTESWVAANISRIEAVSSALESSADWTLPEMDVADLAGTPS